MLPDRCPQCDQAYVPAPEARCPSCGLDLSARSSVRECNWWLCAAVIAFAIGAAYLLTTIVPSIEAGDSRRSSRLINASSGLFVLAAFGFYAIERTRGRTRSWWWWWSGVVPLAVSGFFLVAVLWPRDDGEWNLIDALGGATLLATLPIAFGIYAMERARGRSRPWWWSGVAVLFLSGCGWVAALWSTNDGEPSLPIAVFAISLYTALPIAFGIYAVDRAQGRSRPWFRIGVLALFGTGLTSGAVLWPGNSGEFDLSNVLTAISLMTVLPIALGLYVLRRRPRRFPKVPGSQSPDSGSVQD